MLQFKSPPPRHPEFNSVYLTSLLVADLVFTAEQWASIVAEVSKIGGGSKQYYAALNFHMINHKEDK